MAKRGLFQKSFGDRNVEMSEVGVQGVLKRATEKHRCPVTASTRKSYIPRLGAIRDYLERRRFTRRLPRRF